MLEPPLAVRRQLAIRSLPRILQPRNCTARSPVDAPDNQLAGAFILSEPDEVRLIHHADEFSGLARRVPIHASTVKDIAQSPAVGR